MRGNIKEQGLDVKGLVGLPIRPNAYMNAAVQTPMCKPVQSC